MRLWININRNGGLGNRLFSRAHVYAAAREFGATVVDWGLADCARHFPRLAEMQPLPRYPLDSTGAPPSAPTHRLLNPAVIGWLRRFRPRRTGRIGPVITQVWQKKNRRTIDLDGAEFAAFVAANPVAILNGFKFRCVDWVRLHASAIRTYFELPQSVRDRWTMQQAAWHLRWTTTVAVHMRGTDFRTAQGGRFYLTPQEYAGLLRANGAIDKTRTLLVLFSDEAYRGAGAYAELCRAFDGFDFVFMHGDAIDDLAGMASCDRVLGPSSSTFSRWAAFAGDRPWAGVAREMLEPGALPIAFRDGLVPWDS